MRKIKNTNTFISILLAILIILLIFFFRKQFNADYKIYYVLLSLNFGYLAFKVMTSFLYKTYEVDEKSEEEKKKLQLTISAIIPCYNESLESVEKVIQSLMQQTTLVNEILFIDDGSESDECFNFLANYENDEINIIVHRFEENKGKKEAILWGITHASSDLLLMLDSDGELTENTIEEMVKPFEDEKIGTVCGRIMVKNYKASFITRIQEIVYFNAFEVGRASQSIFKNVVVASGALSMHRRKIFDEDALETFQKERFFGFKCIAGDDRLLTDLSKEKNYHSIYQNSAICYTEVPEKLSKYFKQQVRWLKSAYLLSLHSLRYSWRKPLLMIYQILEAYLWLINLIITIFIALTKGIYVSLWVILIWIIYALLVSLFNSIKFRQYGFLLYLTSVIYSFVYGILIVIMRIYALLTLWKTGWSTR